MAASLTARNDGMQGRRASGRVRHPGRSSYEGHGNAASLAMAPAGDNPRLPPSRGRPPEAVLLTPPHRLKWRMTKQILRPFVPTLIVTWEELDSPFTASQPRETVNHGGL